MNIPPLTLTLGQVAWALELGLEPKRETLDKLNYLRQLGIPFEQGQRQLGSGNRVNYSYVEMVEMGVGLWALINGIKPGVISKFLIGQRTTLRNLYVQTLADLPAAALDAPWVRSRGKAGALIEGEKFLRLHDKYDAKPGKIELIDAEHAMNPLAQMPLTRMALQWLAWAQQAPIVRAGRRPLTQD